jgi:hypothetical protein
MTDPNQEPVISSESFNYNEWCEKFKTMFLDYRYNTYLMRKYDNMAKYIIDLYQDYVILNDLSVESRGPTVNNFLNRKLNERAKLINSLKSKFNELYKIVNTLKNTMNKEKKDLEELTNSRTTNLLVINASLQIKNIEPGIEKDKLSPSTQDYYSSMSIENIKKEKNRMFKFGCDSLSHFNIDDFLEYDKHYKFLDTLEKQKIGIVVIDMNQNMKENMKEIINENNIIHQFLL